MIWPFKPRVTVYRRRYLDWDKVNTVEDLVNVLQNLKVFSELALTESLWDDPRFKHLLGTRITKLTYVNGCLEKTEEEDESTKAS